MRINLWIILALSLFGCCYGQSTCELESCLDLRTVKACGNVQECIQKVWLKQTPTGLTDNVCDICLKMVKEARDQLQSNETTEELKEVLEGSCKLLWLKPAVETCKKLADEFVPELVAMLSSQMDPETVCTVAKLCNNEEFRMQQENSKECFRCRNFVSAATDFIKNVPKADFKEEVLHVCRSLGSYSDACSLYAPLLGDYYHNQTVYALEKQPCEVVGVCPKYSKSLIPLSETSSWKEAKTKLCSMCPAVAGDFQKQLLRFGSLKDFKFRLAGVCGALALSKGACWSADYPRLFSYLSRDFDPVRFCSQSFGLCNRREEPVPVWPLVPAGANLEGAFGNGSVSGPPPTVPVAKNAGVEVKRAEIAFGDPIDAPLIRFQKKNDCRACVDMFDSIIHFAASDKNYVTNVLSVVCDSVPYSKKCKNFLGLSTFAFVGALSQRFNSKKICPELVPMCNPVGNSDLGQPSANETCTFCLETIQSLKQGLVGEEARARLREYLVVVCDSLPSEYQTTCRNFVNIFVDRTLPDIRLKFSENNTCGFLKLCDGEVKTLAAPEEPSTKKGSCKVCMLVVEELYSEIKDKSNEEEIRKALETVCRNLPGKVRDTCDTIVENYTDEIVKLVLAELKPSDVCKKLRFCPPKDAIAPTTPAPLPRVYLGKDVQPVAVRKITGKIPCNFCLTALRMLLQQLEDQKTEDAIRKALNRLCNYFPEETQDTCKSLIDQYTDDLVDMIVADFNATEICVYLRICGPKSELEKRSFNVATNEIRDRSSADGACQFCTLLQKSLVIPEKEKETAESLLAFLVDVCVVGYPNVYPECKKIVSQKILPSGKDGLLRMENVCAETKVCGSDSSSEKALFLRMEEAVQECALCETLVEIIASHRKVMSKNFDFSVSASLICTTVPPDKKTKCENLLVSYGPSVLNLLAAGTEPQKVCSVLSLCDRNQQAKLNMPVGQVERDPDECVRGPGFWCANVENARKCGTLPHCQEVVWKQKTPPQ